MKSSSLLSLAVILVILAFASPAEARWLNYFNLFRSNPKEADFSCLDQDGNPVEWWMMYKQPHLKNNDEYPTGYEYVYVDANTVSTHRFEKGRYTLMDDKNPIARSLHKAYDGSKDASYMFYNDQPPLMKPPGSTRAHAKGMVLFDNTSGEHGLWIVASLPEFPNAPEPGTSTPWNPVEAANNYGQHFFCNTLNSSADLNGVGRYMKTIVPFIFADNFSVEEVIVSHKRLANVIPELLDAHTVGTASPSSAEGKAAREGVPNSQAIPFLLSGRTATSYAKHRNWAKELYKDLIASESGLSLDVETWRRVHVCQPYCGSPEVNDIQYLHFKDQGIAEWKYTKDHSKWAVSTDNTMICIGDINREESQSKRGGGSLCVKDADLAATFRGVVSQVTKCE